MSSDLARAVEAAWENRESLNVDSKGAPRDAGAEEPKPT